MSGCITISVTAKNEERSIGATLESLLKSVKRAEDERMAKFEVVAILDDCTDNTDEVVRRFASVGLIHSSGGLIEAQRKIASQRPFVIFSDADILIDENVIGELARTMMSDPALQVAYPRKRPLPPGRQSLMADALYCYNRVEGFQHSRRYFNGKLFAIRDWNAPSLEELANRLSTLPLDNFYDFHAGLRVDDIWLSRDILRRYGADAIREVPDAEIHYRPPATFEGMYRMYLRMRREIERLDLMFPETRRDHQTRGYDREAERRAPLRDRFLWRIFRVALGICHARYVAERFYFQRVASRTISAWKPVSETKASPSADSVRRM